MARKLKTRFDPAALPTDFAELVRLHPPMPVHDAVAYRNTMEVIDALAALPAPSKGQTDFLETLSVLADVYESDDMGLKAPDVTPLQTLKALVDEHGLTTSDLGRLLGDRTLGSKILSGKRELSKEHIRTLADRFSVRADVFI